MAAQPIATSNPNVQIDARGRVASLSVTQAEFDQLAQGALGPNVLATRLYQCFKDSFDFIFFVQNASASDYSQYYTPVCDDVSGIGKKPMNATKFYGSAGHLKGTIIFPALWEIVFGATLHEMAHCWGNYILPTWGWNGGQIIGTGNQADADDGSHWGISSVNGELGGFDPAKFSGPDANGYYTVGAFFGYNNTGGNSRPYSALELYLMGLAPESEVNPVDVYSDITDYTEEQVRIDLPGGYYQYERHPKFKGTKTTYTIGKIKELAGGARAPAYGSAQSQFRVLTVVVTPQPLTQDVWDQVDGYVQWFGYTGQNANYTGPKLLSYDYQTGAYAPIDLVTLQRPLLNFYQATKGRAKLLMENIRAELK